jgi:hypothetical protein
MTSDAKLIRLTPGCLRAIGAGRKSQMRTVVKDLDGSPPDGTATCPVGAPGDLLRTEDGALLRIARVRVERLQDIGDEDLGREGGMWHETALPGATPSERQGFARWWDDVHSRPEAQWAQNPWVWVIEFERI